MEEIHRIVTRIATCIGVGLLSLGLAACESGGSGMGLSEPARLPVAAPQDAPGPERPAVTVPREEADTQVPSFASPPSASVAETAPPSPLEERWGIRLLGIRWTAGGNMLDFRYRVKDPEKAAPLLDRGTKPYLIDGATGARLAVPSPPKAGPLRAGGPLRPETNYFVLFSNPGGMVRRGGKVTVVIGDFRAEDLTVQ